MQKFSKFIRIEYICDSRHRLIWVLLRTPTREFRAELSKFTTMKIIPLYLVSIDVN
jgi:hypothetical protein